MLGLKFLSLFGLDKSGYWAQSKAVIDQNIRSKDVFSLLVLSLLTIVDSNVLLVLTILTKVFDKYSRLRNSL